MKTSRSLTCILGVLIVLVYIGLAQAGSITFDNLRKNTKINRLDFDDNFFTSNRAMLVYKQGSEQTLSSKDGNKFVSPKGNNDSFRLTFQDGVTSIDFDMLAGKRKALDFDAKFYDANGNLLGNIDDFLKRDKKGVWHFSFASDSEIAYMIFTDHNRKLNLGFDNFQFGAGATPSAPVPEPATVLLLGFGLGVLGLRSLRSRKKSG